MLTTCTWTQIIIYYLLVCKYLLIQSSSTCSHGLYIHFRRCSLFVFIISNTLKYCIYYHCIYNKANRNRKTKRQFFPFSNVSLYVKIQTVFMITFYNSSGQCAHALPELLDQYVTQKTKNILQNKQLKVMTTKPVTALKHELLYGESR